MKQSVIRRRVTEYKVPGPIVRFVAIHMMNACFLREATTKRSLGNQDMLVHIPLSFGAPGLNVTLRRLALTIAHVLPLLISYLARHAKPICIRRQRDRVADGYHTVSSYQPDIPNGVG